MKNFNLLFSLFLLLAFNQSMEAQNSKGLSHRLGFSFGVQKPIGDYLRYDNTFYHSSEGRDVSSVHSVDPGFQLSVNYRLLLSKNFGFEMTGSILESDIYSSSFIAGPSGGVNIEGIKVSPEKLSEITDISYRRGFSWNYESAKSNLVSLFVGPVAGLSFENESSGKGLEIFMKPFAGIVFKSTNALNLHYKYYRISNNGELIRGFESTEYALDSGKKLGFAFGLSTDISYRFNKISLGVQASITSVSSMNEYYKFENYRVYNYSKRDYAQTDIEFPIETKPVFISLGLALYYDLN